MTESASIRYNNPGAMWDGKIAKRWKSVDHVVLADGQANHIAIFPDRVSGAAAQFDLWRSNYCNMSLEEAVKKWSGGNASVPYMTFLRAHTGFNPDTLISPVMLSGPSGISLMQAQAAWEAGKPYPMSDAEWSEAQRRCFAPSSVRRTIAVTTAVATGVGGSHAAIQSGAPPFETLFLIVGIAVTVFGVWFFFFRDRN
jgi:hypothetical protein